MTPRRPHAAPARGPPLAGARRRRRRDGRADRRRPRQAVAARAGRRPPARPRRRPFELTDADARLLAAVAAVVLLIAVVEAGAQYATDLWLQAAGERISHDLRVRVYDHLQRLSLGFHQQRQKGDLVTRVTGDVNAMGDLFSQSLGAMVQAALLSIGMTVVLLVIDPVLALVALATAPLMAALSYVYRRRVRTQSRVRRAQEGHIASIAVGGAVGDGGGQGVRLGGLREPARARGIGAAAGLGRRGGAAAGALRRARRLGARDQHRARARVRRASASRTARSAPASCSCSPATRARRRARCAASRAR